MRSLATVATALSLFVTTSGITYGAIVKGDLVFDDNAFADSASIVAGSVGNGRPLSEILAGSNLGISLGIGDFNRGEIINVSFLDNSIINGPGHDLVVYEKHAADGFDLALQIGPDIFSEYRHFETIRQNFSESGHINAAFIDLSDFGISAFSSISTVRVLEDDGDSAELTGFAAIHSTVPEPATWALASIALMAISMTRRLPSITSLDVGPSSFKSTRATHLDRRCKAFTL